MDCSSPRGVYGGGSECGRRECDYCGGHPGWSEDEDPEDIDEAPEPAPVVVARDDNDDMPF